MKKIIFLFFILFQLKDYSQTTTLVPVGSNWKYLDNGSNQGTAWYGTSFNDASWASGNAELGYGDADETTVVSYGSNSNLKFTTTYFRKTINVPNASSFAQFTINFRRDDGSVIYINGVEVDRNNMPNGVISFNTLASTACSDDGNTVQTFNLPANALVNGNNTIAIEIHQSGPTSSDISLEFELLGMTSLAAPTLVKGPYLQIGTQNSMIVRWETNTACDTKLAYGTSSTALTSTLGNSTSLISHSVQITGLNPFTKYYYSVGTLTAGIIQGAADNFFVTSPVPGTPGKYRFWVVGDCGNASTNQTNCKNQYNTYTGNTVTNGWLLLGDNAYSNGSDPQFNAEFFNIYQTDIMKNAVLWPAPGNHDYNNGASTSTTVPYYSIFSTPTSAQAGGVASNNPAYYSYNYGNIHFISLDSYGTVSGNKMYDTLGAQAVWLKADLLANTQRWTIAYWHHPPYTMGSHNSDLEPDLVQVRTNFVRILERNKVDMIMCGHSHDYERSKLMKGHYGFESSFNSSTHNLSSSTALYDGSLNSCPYKKDSLLNKNGTVYVLSGSAGQLGGTQTSFPHAAMYYSNATNGGSLILDIENNRLDAKWLGADGVIRDKFTIFKDVNNIKTYTVLPGATTNLTATWPSTVYLWSNSTTASSIAVSPTTNTTYWVQDANTCVADTFKVRVLPAVNFNSAANICANVASTFTDVSSNAPISWNWSVNPAATISSATSQNPNITFATLGIYSISLIANNAYGAGTIVTQTVNVTICSGIKQLSASNANLISVYPNPNNGNFAIDVNGKGTFEVKVINSIGQLIYSTTLTEGTTAIDLKSPVGIYYYTVTQNKETISGGKIIVQK